MQRSVERDVDAPVPELPGGEGERSYLHPRIYWLVSNDRTRTSHISSHMLLPLK